ncbi:MFS transporter [Mycobacterium sp. NPDC003449]
MSTATGAGADTAATLRRAALASTVGSAIEFYEFTVYGFLAVVFAPLFFTSDQPTAATLSALAVFGGGYLARPLGGVIFGTLGDRMGRKPVLMLTIFLMGSASMAIGVLPGYAQIGIAAPVLLLILRILQGLSAGGEFTGAQTYIVEMAPRNRRAVYGSLPAFGIGVGFGFGALTVGTMTVLTTAEQMVAWGWRIPFLLCIPLTAVCLLIRRRLEESPGFRQLKQSGAVVRTPILDVLQRYWREVLKVAGLSIAILGPAFLAKLYMAIYLIQDRGMDSATVYLALGALLLVSTLLYPVMGTVSDRLGRKPLILGGCLAYLVLTLPMFLLVTSTTSLWAIAPVLLAFMVIEPAMAGAVYTSFAELFPERIRYTGTSVGFNLGTIVAAGFGPYICAQLVAVTGSLLSPAIWGIGCAAVGMLAYLTLPETSSAAISDRTAARSPAASRGAAAPRAHRPSA